MEVWQASFGETSTGGVTHTMEAQRLRMVHHDEIPIMHWIWQNARSDWTVKLNVQHMWHTMSKSKSNERSRLPRPDTGTHVFIFLIFHPDEMERIYTHCTECNAPGAGVASESDAKAVSQNRNKTSTLIHILCKRGGAHRKTKMEVWQASFGETSTGGVTHTIGKCLILI